MLGALFAQWRYAAAGLIFAAAVIFAWNAAVWRSKAAELGAARAEIRRLNNVALRAHSFAIDLAKKLEKAEKETAAKAGKSKEVIRRVVTIDPRCDLEPSVLRVLNDLRVPAAPAAPAPATRRPGTVAGG